ncbi:hypothetical protein [Deinococcus sp.]|uniref:hypothetical protein n=1 Tax=Deinococcus sp. TaxID=47478 RepID=UPI002869C846|nr:hypothetical protein [Deinococcus sp.]
MTEVHSDPQTGQLDTVVRQHDGTTVYTHGHRFPDNVQIVEQRHDAQGKLQSAKLTWSGFAGQVLDVTATFDAAGKLVKEEGYRAPEMTTPVTELVKSLPKEVTAAPMQVPASTTPATSQTPSPATATTTAASLAPLPATLPDALAEGLHRIYPHPDKPDGSDT